MLTREDFLKTVEKLQKAAETYYTTDTQIITDSEYDYLLEQVETAAAANNWTEADNLIHQVAAGYSSEKTITHTHPMLSMLKVKTVEEVNKFINTVSADVIVEPKLDGLAVALQYKNGKLFSAATRGDGFIGENITTNIINNTIKNLPHTINIKTPVEIRGELYMTHEDFTTANKERQKRTGKPFANSRNATAGIIRNENETQPYATLSFATYDTVGLQTTTYVETVALLLKEGFQPAYSLTEHITGTVEEQIEIFGKNKTFYDFPTDGIVVKANLIADRKKLGEGTKYPHWARAYKYEDEQQITILNDIELSIGRTGALTLTANFNPVQLEGTTVTKATLNNVDYVKNNNIKIGGEIIIQKANMIIPQIVAGINNENFPEYNPSTLCPQCNQQMDTTTSVIWRCLNTECSILESIIYWCSPAAMDIDGLSEKLVTAMLEQNLITTVFDLYSLTVDQLSNMVVKQGASVKGEKFLFGQKRAETLITNINASKQQPLWRLLAGLNIRHLGRTLSKTIVKNYTHIDEVFALTVEQLKSLEGIAEEKATVIHEGLQSKQHLLPLIKKIGFTVEVEKNKTTATNNDWVAGKKFVITGSFENYNREELKEQLESLGGVSSSSVTSKTDILIAGSNAGSKLVKAENFGTLIINEKQLTVYLTA